MELEDLQAAGHDVQVPRYAAHGVWVSDPSPAYKFVETD